MTSCPTRCCFNFAATASGLLSFILKLQSRLCHEKFKFTDYLKRSFNSMLEAKLTKNPRLLQDNAKIMRVSHTPPDMISTFM